MLNIGSGSGRPLLDDLDKVSNSMDTWFDSMLGSWPIFTSSIAKRLAGPTVDVEDKGSEYLVKADIPGMKKEDIKVSVHENLLEIEGSREEEKKEEDKKKGYFRSERFSGSFHRAIGLPEEVAKDKVQAKYENGVLVLHLPKANGGKNDAKRVSIQ